MSSRDTERLSARERMQALTEEHARVGVRHFGYYQSILARLIHHESGSLAPYAGDKRERAVSVEVGPLATKQLESAVPMADVLPFHQPETPNQQELANVS